MFAQRHEPKSEPLLVDVREAARRLSVCERTVSHMVERGELTPVRIGRAVRFSVSDLRGWVEGRTKEKSQNDEDSSCNKCNHG